MWHGECFAVGIPDALRKAEPSEHKPLEDT